MTISEQQAAQIEKIGVKLEQTDFPLPPLTARIMALLLVAEPPYCSFEEILENLKSSKSSVSTSLNFLLREGLVDYRTFPGDRKRYFQINAESWMRMFRKRIEQMAPIRALFNEIIQARSPAYPEFNQMLKEMNEFHAEFEEVMRTLLDRWLEMKEK